jgi:hypothetical protein
MEVTRGVVEAGMPVLLSRAPAAALAVAAGTTWPAAVGVSAKALALARAALKGMGALKLKMALGLTLAVVLAATQAALATSRPAVAKYPAGCPLTAPYSPDDPGPPTDQVATRLAGGN